jgi:hypothetical protein
MFEFIKSILFLKTQLGGGLAPSSQTVGSLLIPPGWKTSWENDLCIAPMDLTNIDIQPTQT